MSRKGAKTARRENIRVREIGSSKRHTEGKMEKGHRLLQQVVCGCYHCPCREPRPGLTHWCRLIKKELKADEVGGTTFPEVCPLLPVCESGDAGKLPDDSGE